METDAYTEVNTDRQALLEAAKLIREKGHCKGRLFNDAGQHCIGGALMEVNPSGNSLGFQPQVDAIEAVLLDEFSPPSNGWHDGTWYTTGDHGWSNMVDWNNAPDTTQDEVIHVLEAAAARV